MIVNFNDYDPFSDSSTNNTQKIHLRSQARNGKKCITTLQGLNPELDLKKMLKTFKKNFSCNGAIRDDKEMGQILQLSGDQRLNIKNFLVKEKIVTSENIIIHGI